MKRSVLLVFLLLDSCCEKPEEQAEEHLFSFTVVEGTLPDPPQRFREVSEKIYRLIDHSENPRFLKYTETMPLAGNATFEMIPIQGGQFLMGSSHEEPDPQSDEHPAHPVHVDSFWMASTETTWLMYQAFINQFRKDGRYILRDEFGFPEEHRDQLENLEPVDMISSPSAPYSPEQAGPVTARSSEAASTSLKKPAVGMTRHSALKFCQWLTAQTGHYYRLPTEAEWEYACRAGTSSRYSFDDRENDLRKFAWYFHEENDEYIPRQVGLLKPNPWGLYDMHGNVAEWTLDSHRRYRASKHVVKNPISFAAKLHRGVVRGGHFDSDPHQLRSAARLPASPRWNDSDPQAPRSIWYNSSVIEIGFRIVRPRRIPSLTEAHLIWNIDSGKFWNW